jgi:hypothetical protein
MFRRHAKTDAQESARAGRGHRTRVFDRHRFEAARRPHQIQGACEIRGGVGERTIEIEEDCFDQVRRFFRVGFAREPACCGMLPRALRFNGYSLRACKMYFTSVSRPSE